MMETLDSPFLHFSLDLSHSCWSLFPKQEHALAVEGARMSIAYHTERLRRTLEHWGAAHLSKQSYQTSQHGLLQQLTLSFDPDAHGVSYQATFALPEDYPLFFWWFQIHNGGDQPIYLDRLTFLRADFPPLSRTSRSAPATTAPAFFSNGWGSWNYTGAYGAQERFRRTRLGPFSKPMRVNAGTPHPKDQGHFGSDMFGVLGDRHSRAAILAGFLSQQEHFGSLEAWLRSEISTLGMWANGDRARLDPGHSLSTDWVCLCFLDVDDPDPLRPYLEAVARQHNLPPPQANARPRSPVGWCSWYHFFGKVIAEDLQRNLRAAADLRPTLPLEVFQIDDGYETWVGDWFSFKPSFPQGVAPLARQIRDLGFTPGLWLAPFIVDPHSRLAKEHPDWLLRGRFNRPANAGFVWNTFTTALDLTKPAALNYVREVIRTAVHEWGFPYLKLDFLYAAALPGDYQDATRTRAQVLRAGLQAIREAAGEKAFLLGCGCPLGPAIGLVDAMRIGPDVNVTWLPSLFGNQGLFKNEPDIPSAYLSMHNALTRAPLHQRWWINDPDCLLLRPSTQLTLAEVQSIATVIALTGGSFLLSDDLPELPAERLRVAQVMLPLIDRSPRILDWFDRAMPARLRLDLENASGAWHLLALFNWDDQPQDLLLRLDDFDLQAHQAYWAREFWRGESYLIKDGLLTLKNIPAHGVALLAVRPHSPEVPVYIGSDLHISQGLEVTAWNWRLGELSLCLERPGAAQGHLELSLSRPPQKVLLDGAPLAWTTPRPGCYRFVVDFVRNAEIELSLL